MKKILYTLILLCPATTYLHAQNVGIGNTNPHTKLEVTGALSSTPASAPAAASVIIPDNTSIFRLSAVAGVQANVLTVNTPQEGQYLTIYNEDSDAATFASQTISGSGGLMTFEYIDAGWRLVSNNQATNIYTADGTLTGNRTVTMGANNLTFNSTTGNLLFGSSPSTGRAGIGTAVPLYKLHVMFTSGTDGMILQNTSGGAAGTVNMYFATYRDLTAGVSHPDARISAIDDGYYSAAVAFSTKVPGSDANPLTERMRVSDYGVLGIGTTTPGSGPTTSAALDIRDQTGLQSDIQQVVAGQSGGSGYPGHAFVKQRGTLAGPASAISGDKIGMLQAVIYTYSGYQPAADIYFQVDTAMTTDAPGSIHFGTTPKGTIAPLDRMIIKNSGFVGIGTDTPMTTLHVAGTTRTTNFQMTTGATNGYILKSDASGNASWVNPTTITTVSSVSNTSAANTLSTTVNGVTGTAVLIVNTISNTSAGNAISTTVNGVASTTVPIINSHSLSLSGTLLTSTVNGVASNAQDISSIDNNIYNSDGTLSANRIMTMGADNLTLNSTTGNLIFNPSSTGRLGVGITNPYQTVSIQNPGGLSSGAETATHCLSLLTGTTVGSDYILYMGADKTNNVSYLQSVKWGTAAANLSLNARGGNVGIGTSGPENKLHILHSSITDGLLLQNTVGGGVGTTNIFFATYSDVTPGVSHPGGRISAIDDNAYSAHITFATKAPGADANALVERMRLQSNGYLGIGTTSPQAPLDVEESISTTIPTVGGNRSYFESNFSSLSHDNGGASGTISILASGWIMTYSGFMSASDARIKNVIGISNGVEDLNSLNRIKITDYTMRDKVANGDGVSKKVIAQQIREVYPAAVNVSQQAKYVPNIFHLANSFDVNGPLLTLYMDTVIKEDKDIHTGSPIRCYLSEKTNEHSQKEINGTIESISDGSVTIHTANTLDALKYDAVFVYGTEVNDFLTVDYDAISMLNVSATQELSRQLKDAQAQIATLKQENEKANTQTNQLQSDIEKLKTSIETLQQFIGAKAER